MKRKMLLVALALVCALTCAFGLVACDNGNNDNGGTGNNGSNGGDNKPSHTHTYSTTWTRNETHHWHNCTITGCEEKDGYAEHDLRTATAFADKRTRIFGRKLGKKMKHTIGITVP